MGSEDGRGVGLLGARVLGFLPNKKSVVWISVAGNV